MITAAPFDDRERDLPKVPSSLYLLKNPSKTRRFSPAGSLADRLLDIMASTVALTVLLPGFAVVAILIAIDTRGPVLYRHKRFGKKGTTFAMYKFRSMVPNADRMKQDVIHLNESDGPHFKIKNDPRITRVGKWLRKLSVDELPQFINVFRGEMTLVGPRAMCVSELDLTLETHWARLSVKPGLLCLREVTGRSRLSFDDWIASDLEYIANKSFFLNLKILARAVPAILKGDGAY